MRWHLSSPPTSTKKTKENSVPSEPPHLERKIASVVDLSHLDGVSKAKYRKDERRLRRLEREEVGGRNFL